MTKEELITAVERLYGKDRFDFSLVPENFRNRDLNLYSDVKFIMKR